MPMQNVFTGKTARIMLNSTAPTPEGKDASVILKTSFAPDAPVVVGRATGIQVAVQTDLEEFHEIGHRHPIVLQPGDIHISGSLDRAYIAGGLVMLLLGRRAQQSAQPDIYVQPSFTIQLDLNDPNVPTNTAELVIDGVKFQNWGFKMPEDDVVMENVSFRALTISVIDTEDGKAQTYGFAS
ncbi:hypothetical protein [Caballeronia novacaledonica]|uniref:Uncharacterized protein n=1 Tax=Caballeronia novacaledonica TaxID=1544861 RepID=A0AA37MU63_9BURK|nr:hypothetical protein [Caballeronia novacaledonica]GJH28947.1 hypothetical protein CBA19CS42_30545 [Caballeronia novacaledonica]